MILGTLEKDYLGCVASSSSVKQTFSLAADVCASNCGRLLPRTIERSVSSCLWLRDDLPLGNYFEGETKQINNFKLFCEEKDAKRLKGAESQ